MEVLGFFRGSRRKRRDKSQLPFTLSPLIRRSILLSRYSLPVFTMTWQAASGTEPNSISAGGIHHQKR
jgi:hypothetical protein